MIFAMAVLDTPSLRKRRRILSSLPSSRETLSEPFGRPSFRPEDLAQARPSRVRSEIRSRSTSANSVVVEPRRVQAVLLLSAAPGLALKPFSPVRRQADDVDRTADVVWGEPCLKFDEVVEPGHHRRPRSPNGNAILMIEEVVLAEREKLTVFERTRFPDIELPSDAGKVLLLHGHRALPNVTEDVLETEAGPFSPVVHRGEGGHHPLGEPSDPVAGRL